MYEELSRAIETHLAARGEAAHLVDASPVGGGCINDARIAELSDGRRLFVKTNSASLLEMFERETEGLEALAAVGALRVPRDAFAGTAGGQAFLVMEAIPLGRKGPAFFERFGRAFAELHRRGRGERFGFAHDNFIGSTPQPNTWTDDGAEFWRRHRLGHQLELARRGGRSSAELDRLGERLLARLGDHLDLPGEPPCLLHGDLWGGNYLVDDAGDPVLIDPACYYGHREADLAMTQLFGGFDPRFYAAYEEAWPLPPGSGERLEIFKLYHLLNHLNLFGGSYRGSCLQILRRFA